MNKLLRISNTEIYDTDTTTCYTLSLDAGNGDVLTIEKPSDIDTDRTMELADGAAHNLWAYLVRYSRDERTSAQRVYDLENKSKFAFDLLIAKMRYALTNETPEEITGEAKRVLQWALIEQEELNEL